MHTLQPVESKSQDPNSGAAFPQLKSPRLRVLLVCDRYPWPLQNGQNLRIFHYVSRLHARHRFDLVCHGEGEPPEELGKIFRSIEHFPLPPVIRRRGPDRIRYAFSVSRMFPDSAEVREHLTRIVHERHYDVIWVSGWGMLMNLPNDAWPIVLADGVDDGVLEYWREFKASRTARRAVLMGKWLLMNYLFERHYFGRAAQCLFVSDVDAAVFHRVCPRTPVTVINNGVDEDYYQPRPVAVQPLTLVFEGKMDFRPNADGIVAFCRDVFPIIRRAVPGVRLRLVGMDPPPEVRALASSYVEVTGFVDDVRPSVAQAAVFICPLRKGAGIKNKVLQAWAMGKAVVATPSSVGGLLVDEGRNIIVRPLDRSFAEAVIGLLQDPQRAIALGKQARRTIVEHYTWDRQTALLERLIETVANASPRYRHA